MFRKLIKNKKAQNTAEYAILISLVVAGIIAMQTYAQRALQARVRDASEFMTDQGAGNFGMAATYQYEPYYLESNYQIDRNEADTQVLAKGVVSQVTDSTRNRAAAGFQRSTYNGSMFGNLAF